MCDTNWCTFCDCAVSPLRNSIYCSEECFRRDAVASNPILANYQKQIAQQQQQQQQMNIANLKSLQRHSNTNMTSQTEYCTNNNTRRDSNSSISSDCLAAMYFESMAQSESSTPNDKKITTPVTPCLSASSTSSHSTIIHTAGIDECYTAMFSFKEEFYDKTYEDNQQIHPLQTFDCSQLRI